MRVIAAATLLYITIFVLGAEPKAAASNIIHPQGTGFVLSGERAGIENPYTHCQRTIFCCSEVFRNPTGIPWPGLLVVIPGSGQVYFERTSGEFDILLLFTSSENRRNIDRFRRHALGTPVKCVLCPPDDSGQATVIGISTPEEGVLIPLVLPVQNAAYIGNENIWPFQISKGPFSNFNGALGKSSLFKGSSPQGPSKNGYSHSRCGSNCAVESVSSVYSTSAAQKKSDIFLDDEERFFVKLMIGFVFFPLAYAISKLK
jgi:hypothetical protein